MTVENIGELTKDQTSMSLRTLVEADLRELTTVVQATGAAIDPISAKTLRTFSVSEAASYIGVSRQYLTRVVEEMELELERVGAANARVFSIEDMNSVRRELFRRNQNDLQKTVQYLPHRRENEELSVATFTNLKRRTAKTTGAVHFAMYLGLKGYRVLFLDLDPQGAASKMFGYNPVLVEEDDSLYSVLRYANPRELSDIIKETYFPNLHIALGGDWLSQWEHDTSTVMRNANYTESEAKKILLKMNSEKAASLDEAGENIAELDRRAAEQHEILQQCTTAKQYFLKLRRKLESVKENFDVVVCDTQPSLQFLTQTAIGASNHLFATLQSEWLDIKSTQQYLTFLSAHLSVLERSSAYDQDTGQFFGRTLHYVLTHFEQGNTAQSDIAAMLRGRLRNTLESSMPSSPALSQAGQADRSLYENFETEFSRDTYKRTLDAMNRLNQEMLDVLLKGWGRK
ncbi:AAA family ATPase [Pseudovibrio ascidiaceicola]|uniref:AAA family ATPase n=1 Tax=Pseudovibrio ascidiaceicola TaxID=285279 RepID=UPI003D3627EA